jgi:hypothetical protein
MNHGSSPPLNLLYYGIIYGGAAGIYIGPSMSLVADEFIGNMHIFEMTPRDLHLGGSIYHLDRNKTIFLQTKCHTYLITNHSWQTTTVLINAYVTQSLDVC